MVSGGGDAVGSHSSCVSNHHRTVNRFVASIRLQPNGDKSAPRNEFAKQNETCFQCHSGLNPGLGPGMAQQRSRAKGASAATTAIARNKTDSDAFEHNGAMIARHRLAEGLRAVPPKRSRSAEGNHHAKAGEILASLDNFLGEVVGGPPAVASAVSSVTGRQ